MSVQSEKKVTRRGAFTGEPVSTLVEELGAKLVFGEVAVDPANAVANSNVAPQVALPAGTASAGDLVFVQPPSTLEAGLVPVGARISATDQLEINIRNCTAGAIDGVSRTWTWFVVKAAKITHS
jgi:hypothetical protein